MYLVSKWPTENESMEHSMEISIGGIRRACFPHSSNKFVFFIDGAQGSVFFVVARFAAGCGLASGIDWFADHIGDSIIAAVREGVGIFYNAGTECDGAAADENGAIVDHLREMAPCTAVDENE